MPQDATAAGRDRTTSETIETLLNRVSVRKFSDRPVSDEVVEAILRASFRAPTSSNIQSYSVVVVRDMAVREKLYPITGNQKHILTAPVFLAFCADLTRIEEATRMNGHGIDDNNLEIGLVSSIDAALVGQSAYLAADSLGLKGVMIGAVRNDATASAEALGLPHRVYCVFGMCLGYPDEAPAQKPRPAPVTTIAITSLSSFAALIASAISIPIRGVHALSFSGRFMVTVSTPSTTLVRIVSYCKVPPRSVLHLGR